MPMVRTPATSIFRLAIRIFVRDSLPRNIPKPTRLRSAIAMEA